MKSRKKIAGRTSRSFPSKFPPRVGIGYDIHRFDSDRKLMLGGVRIPYALGLAGHSDADALLHAICDALLGAAALGDIGKHFPDTDRKFKNIPSVRLLSYVRRLLKGRGFEILNIDSTVILQEPRIARFIPSMQRKIAGALDITVGSVSVKATTNEGLGHLGRGAGCAAYAIAFIQPVGH